MKTTKWLLVLLILLYVSCVFDDEDTNETKYSISGYVTTNTDEPISGVSISTGTKTAYSDAEGYFIFTDLQKGPYTLTPFKTDYTFEPVSHTFTLADDRSDISFIGTDNGNQGGNPGGNGDETGDPPVIEDYYKLHVHTVQTEDPAYINILFQASDSNDKGISSLTSDDFVVTEDGSAISPTESGMTIKKIDEVPYIIRTVLMIDNSPSVQAVFPEIKAAALELVKSIVPNQEVAVFSFNSTAHMVQGFTSDKAALQSSIESLSVPFGNYSTNLYGAIVQGVSLWEDIYDISSQVEQGYLVAITDGSDEASLYSLTSALQARGNKSIYTIGLGSEIDVTVLEQLGNRGFYAVADIATLKSVYGTIQKDIIKYANSFYWLSYLSGLRDNATHSIKLEVKNNVNNERSSYIQQSFSSSGFKDLPGGVFIKSTGKVVENIDEITTYEGISKQVTATSFWNREPSSYAWESSNPLIANVQIDNSDGSLATITAIGEGMCTIMVTDSNNIEYHENFSKTIPITVIKNIDIDQFLLVKIPSGSFSMGDHFDAGNHDEIPVHMVTVSGFEMSTYEITQEQYESVMGVNPSSFRGENMPVDYVSWFDAVLFCNALSIQANLTPCYDETTWACDFDANGFRLPTEAEWEYACRAGTETKYYTGNGISNLSQAGWWLDNSGVRPHTVGQKEPNGFGLYDMHGNVYEWCNDWYGSYESTPVTDPTGSYYRYYRVIRSGCYSYVESTCRSASRSAKTPETTSTYIGFRVVRRP